LQFEGASAPGGEVIRAMKLMCPYCSVEYTLESPCFCHPAVTAAPPESNKDTMTLSEPRHAPGTEIAVILALRQAVDRREARA
jgi:hypothetical protein